MADAQTKREKGPFLREINQSPWGQETLSTNCYDNKTKAALQNKKKNP